MSTLDKHWAYDVYLRVSNCALRNRAIIEKSDFVGCYYCLNIYKASKIKYYVDENSTALCCICDCDSVLGDASEFPVKDQRFLEHMHWYAYYHSKQECSEDTKCVLCSGASITHTLKNK